MNKKNIIFIGLCFFVAGCAEVKETAKVIWGSSVASLEKREDFLSKIYQGTFNECFDAVLNLDRSMTESKMESGFDLQKEGEDGGEPQGEEDMEARKIFHIFSKDRVYGNIVVMGISGNVDTTKVAIFFESISPRTTKIKISSHSSTAKEKVANIIFDALHLKFSQVQ